jgi:hypothetical protein
VDHSTYRRVMIGSIVALVAVVAAVWLINPLGDDAALPDPLEEVFPLPGDTVVRQTVISIDVPVGYDIEIEVDGIRIPQAEIGTVQATGRRSWGPGPGRLWEMWEPGEHSVTVTWTRQSGRPDTGEYTWSFRIA